MNQKVDSRNYGIDLLKTVSMFMVVVLHVLLHSDFLNKDLSTPQYWAGWLLEIFAYCAVNCFALASGFLLVDRPFRYRKILPLWATVFAWSAVISAAAFFIIPEKFNFSWVFDLLPVTSGAWWYFTAYFALFMLIPLLNKALMNMTKRQWQLTVLVGFLLFCCFRTVFFWNVEPFKLNDGYSAWWLMYLYIVGAGIKRHDAFKSVNAARGGGRLPAVCSSYLGLENGSQIYRKNRAAAYIDDPRKCVYPIYLSDGRAVCALSDALLPAG